MKKSDRFPSRYLRAADFEDEDVTFIISEVTQEMLKGDDGKDKKVNVVYFEGDERGFVLNMTNDNTISYMHGDDSDDWIGKPITLYHEVVPFKGEMKPAIRIRVVKEKKAAHRVGERQVKASTPEYDDDGYPIK